jgi:hypothetical protein
VSQDFVCVHIEKTNHWGGKMRKKPTVITIDVIVITVGFDLGNRTTNNKTDYFTA